ncbi:MAG: glycosyltransferase family 2 protein, partial [Bacteroidota bacterium]
NIQAEYFVLLNSDVEVSPNWLDPLIHFLENNEGYAACQPKIKDYNQQTKFEYAGACGGFIDTLGYPYCRGRIFDNIEVDHGQYDQPTDVFWSSGACMAIRSKVFFEVGEFDSDFFAHMEEIDLCWRIQSHGYRIKCIPASTVYHVGGGTLNKSSAFKTYLNFRNGLYLLLKNLPKSALFTKIPMRMALDWLASIKFLLEGSPGHAIAIVKAHTSFISNFRKTYNKRSINSNLPDSKMLVFRYYLKKQKVFNKI